MKVLIFGVKLIGPSNNVPRQIGVSSRAGGIEGSNIGRNGETGAGHVVDANAASDIGLEPAEREPPDEVRQERSAVDITRKVRCPNRSVSRRQRCGPPPCQPL